MDGAGPGAHWRLEGPSRKDGKKLTQALQNTQWTSSQAALFLTLAWSTLGISDAAFEPFQILTHLSLLRPLLQLNLTDPASGVGHTRGCAVDGLPGDCTQVLTSHVANL